MFSPRLRRSCEFTSTLQLDLITYCKGRGKEKMELQDKSYVKSEFIETASGNKVSRQSVLCGSQNIVLNGKTIIMSECIIRGDLANVRIGRHCVINKRSVIRPPFKKFSKGVAFFPLHIGDNVYIEEDCIVNAAQIGSNVYIGKNCIIGRRSVLKDCCVIADNTVLPPETVVPPFTLMAGSPGRAVAELPECTQDNMADLTKSFYQHFIPIIDEKSKAAKTEHSSRSSKSTSK